VEFWARTPAYSPKNSSQEGNAELFSFATFIQEEGELLLLHANGCGAVNWRL
jgi:hypothetical protein